MAKVPPYHTDFEEHPAEYRDVYHGHDDCPDGRLILPHHRRSGTGGKPQCNKCAELNSFSHTAITGLTEEATESSEGTLASRFIGRLCRGTLN